MSKSELIEYKKQVLDTKSRSFCGAKWYNATVFLGSGRTMSCHHNPYHHINDSDVVTNYKALHNTNIKKQQRQSLLNGEKPEECNYCWRVEDMDPDAISDRIIKSRASSNEDLDLAYNSDPNADFDLQIMELHFDKVCQMACSYCHSGYSTTWAQDIRKHGAYQDVDTDLREHYKYERRTEQLFKPDQENLYVEAFYKWWDADLHKTLKELRILGGEPLLSPHIWKFIEWFKRKDTNCRLEIVSNLGPKVDVLKFLEAIDGKKVVVMTSMETVGEHAEYIRDGVDYDLWVSNVGQCLESNSIEKVVVLFTVNCLSMFMMPDLLDQITKWRQQYGKDRLQVSFNILRYPAFQNLTTLPKQLYDKVLPKLQTWLDTNSLDEYEHAQLTRVISYATLVDEPNNIFEIRGDFKSFFKQYDKRRGKNLLETFPEIKDWYNEIT